MEALSKFYRTYAVGNIHDHGRSVYTRRLKSGDDFVRWLDHLFGALELGDDINLMGISYGGWLTTQYALRFPERLDKIVLLAPAGTVLPLRLEWMVRAILCAIPNRYFTRSFMYWLLGDFVRKHEANRPIVEEWVAEIIPDAGHDLTIVQTEMVNRKVLEFLKGQSAHNTTSSALQSPGE